MPRQAGNITPLGKKLKKLRVELELKQHQMAKQLQVSPAFLSLVESGRKLVPEDFLETLCKHYPQIKEQQHEYDVLINMTRQELVIPLAKSSFGDAELATLFVRHFKTLSNDAKQQIYDIINKEEEK